MNNFEFIAYKQINNDKYLKGIVTVRVDKKHIYRFGHKPTKDGGDFFAIANYQWTDDVTQEKKYLAAAMLDSRAEEESLLEFVREQVSFDLQSRSATRVVSTYQPQNFNAPAQSNPVFQNQPTSMKEVAADEQLPF